MPDGRLIGVAISNPAKKTVHVADQKQLYVTNLADSIVEHDLREMFETVRVFLFSVGISSRSD